MGAKKEKNKKVLDHKAKKFKQKANVWKTFNISPIKIRRIEEKQERYEEWLEAVDKGNDY